MATILSLLFGFALQMPQVPPAPPLLTQQSAQIESKELSQPDMSVLLPADRQALTQDIVQKDYRAGQALLLDRLSAATTPRTRNRLLQLLGSVYLLAKDPMQAAIAWNKAAAIQSLPEDLRFSLAMAYVQLGHEDWAEKILHDLAVSNPANALYPFWLGRIDYDHQHYDSAILHFREALQANPSFARAHDNLGLAFYYLNQVDAAIAEFRAAIHLDAAANAPSPWPFLNLGIALDFRGQTAEALSAFREAIAVQPAFAQAHYRLGNLLFRLNRMDEAVDEEKSAIALDSTMAEPHLLLAMLYRRLNQLPESRLEEQEYRRLHVAVQEPATPSPLR